MDRGTVSEVFAAVLLPFYGAALQAAPFLLPPSAPRGGNVGSEQSLYSKKPLYTVKKHNI